MISYLEKESGDKLLAIIEFSHIAEYKLHIYLADTNVNCISVHHQETLKCCCHFVVFLVTQSCPALCDAKTVAHQAPLFIEFSRQEYWSGLPFPSPGDLPDPGIKPGSPVLAGGFFTPSHLGSPVATIYVATKTTNRTR